MLANQNESFPYTTAHGEQWDHEWARDWTNIVEIFDTIDHLELLFNDLNVSQLRQLSQKQLILNLQKYAYSLSRLIIEKYSN